ncbi:hypothetical protein [Candidatus Binatus sp.]|uniref:hypothetical protein n=2 Tax=Candidatus Binatus sp. TaxID=2811406 RepID=UPI003CC67645
MTYRTLDLDSGEELERSRSWQVMDAQGARELTVITYSVGTEVLGECTFASGFARPATKFRSIMRSKSGEIERSDFDTFDPKYYPFLAKPITPNAQPGACVSKKTLDLPTLVRGGQFETWIWSDGGSVGAIFRPEENEKLTVPAGSFDALRVRIDLDLSKVFPHVPELFLKLVKPHFTIWITRREPYYVLKMSGFGNPNSKLHKNTVIELASISELTANDSKIPAELAQADAADEPPSLHPINSGSFTQGDRTGHVTFAGASTPAGEMLVARVAFSNGLATESRTLINHGASPATVYLDDRSFALSGAVVRKHLIFFRKAAFPNDPKKDLPADLYGADMTLGALLPRLLPEGSDEASFHVMDFSGEVSELTIRRDGMMTIALGGDETSAIYAKLKPIVDIPLLLRPLAYFFVPTFDAYFDADSSHRLLKFEGPLGPPGVPNATMLADQRLSGAGVPIH